MITVATLVVLLAAVLVGRAEASGGESSAPSRVRWQVESLGTAYLDTSTTASSASYRLTVRSEPTWVVTITPDRDQLSIPGRVTTSTAPLVALRAAAAAAVPPAQIAGRSELVRSPWRPRARWEDRVCPG